MRRSSSNRSRDALLHDVLEVDHPEHRACPRRPTSGVPPLVAMRSTIGSSVGGHVAALLRAPSARPSRPRPCGSSGPSMSTPLIRVCAVNGTSSAPRELALARGRSAPWPARRSSDPRASRRPGSRAGRRRPASCSVDARRRGRNSAACRLPSVIVPVLSSSSVEQSPAASTARPRHGQHVALHEAVHAGDADGRQQRADGGRDEADEQGDQHDDRLLGAASRWRTAAA